MASEPLPEALKEAGARLLAETDKLGMRAEGAAWIYDHALGDWRYYLVTALADEIGADRVYHNLMMAFPTMRMPEGLTIFDIHLGSPRDAFFRTFNSWLDVTEPEARVVFEQATVNGVVVDALIYRMKPERPSEEIRRAGREFVRNVKRLVAA